MDQSVLTLLVALQDSDYRVAAAAVDGLASTGDPAVIPALLGLLHERQRATISNDVRTGVLAWRAVCVLGKLGGPDLIPHFVAASCEEFSLLRGAVVEALVGIALRTPDHEARVLIKRTLIGFLDDTGVVSVFKRWRVCDEAAKGLRLIESLIESP